MKAQLRRLTKLRQSTRTLKKEYNSLCRRKRRSHKKTVANKVTNLIEARVGSWGHDSLANCQSLPLCVRR